MKMDENVKKHKALEKEQEGVVFDIKQFAVFDGPGIRTTVFLKGCPLRCMWCHNPEGLSFSPQLMVSQNGCTRCGICRKACVFPEKCTLCGACVAVCPNRLRKICGEWITASALSDKLLRDLEYLKTQGGGVTFSGGEPTGQTKFLLECLRRLRPMHRAIETCGYCRSDIFKQILGELDYVIFDLKVINEEKHKYYTGVSNRLILENLEELKRSGISFRVRIPVIPGVNDTEDNYRETAQLLKGAEHLEMVELLPYHETAGAKYEMVALKYMPDFDINHQPKLETTAFKDAGIRCVSI